MSTPDKTPKITPKRTVRVAEVFLRELKRLDGPCVTAYAVEYMAVAAAICGIDSTPFRELGERFVPPAGYNDVIWRPVSELDYDIVKGQKKPMSDDELRAMLTIREGDPPKKGDDKRPWVKLNQVDAKRVKDSDLRDFVLHPTKHVGRYIRKCDLRRDGSESHDSRGNPYWNPLIPFTPEQAAENKKLSEAAILALHVVGDKARAELALAQPRRQGGGDKPGDLITTEVALSEYRTSRPTIARKIKAGKLTDHRPSDSAGNTTYLLSRAELNSLFARK